MPIFIQRGIFWAVLVAAITVSAGQHLRASLRCADCIHVAAPQVLSVRDRLNVVGITAAADAAQVVKFKPFGHRPYEYFVSKDVGLCLLLGIVPQLAVSVPVQFPHENPAPGLGDDLNIGEESGLGVLRPSKLVLGHLDSFQVAVFGLRARLTLAGLFHSTAPSPGGAS